MLEYKELPQHLQEEIKGYCEEDPYGLKPEFLYKNMISSTGSIKTLADLFTVEVSFLIELFEINGLKVIS